MDWESLGRQNKFWCTTPWNPYFNYYFYKILMSIQNAKTHLQKWYKKPTENHQLAKSVFFEKSNDLTLWNPWKNCTSFRNQHFWWFFWSVFPRSTHNVIVHKRNSCSRTVEKHLKKMTKMFWLKKIIILMKAFVGLNRTLPKTCLKIVKKTLENRFIFWCIFHKMQKHMFFLKLYVVVRVILEKSIDFMIDFLPWITNTKIMFFLSTFEYQRFCIDFFNLRN